MKTAIICATIFFCIGLPSVLFGASSEFTIRTQIGSDTIAPTTPVILQAVPVAPTQISLSWSASTDDVAVSGYRVFRNALQIATTTLLNYNDTGLTASTTYTYTVDAFDFFGNFSSTSAPVSTTTLGVIVPPVATTSISTRNSSATRTAPTVTYFALTTTARSASFVWDTSNATQYALKWGRTGSYELGSVSGIEYTKKHTTTIEGLEPGTTYLYELTAIDGRGNILVISTDRFTTQSLFTAEILPNVQNFAAVPQNTDVELTWKNTFSNPNYYVRVVRSHLFYPSSIESGAVVYEGRAQSFIDIEALALRSPQYYSIFVLDGTGAVSSGAVARAMKNAVPNEPSGTGTSATSTLLPDMGDESILRAVDITVTQGGTVQMFDGNLSLFKETPFLISIPYTAVAKNLKSIIVSIQNPTDQREVSAYLFKLNKEGDAYTAYIPGPLVVGTAGIVIEVFDYEQATIRRISNTITFSDIEMTIPFFPNMLMFYIGYVLLALICISLLYRVILFFKKRRNEKGS